jgi:hypothetical protein
MILVTTRESSPMETRGPKINYSLRANESSRVEYCLYSSRDASTLTAHKKMRRKPHPRHLGCHRASGKTTVI